MTNQIITEVKPEQFSEISKREQVEKMFDGIAHRYDFLNHFLSFGIDITWRKKVIGILKNKNPKHILDIATGTADLAIMAAQFHPEKIIGVDISDAMLSIGRKKVKEKKLENLISLQQADSENLPFGENKFDAVTVAFGVRNFQNLDKGLSEMQRVLKAGGTAVILEFSYPKKFPLKQFYHFYFTKVCPFVGKIISKDRLAYSYLYRSVQQFPEGEKFLERLRQAGFTNLAFKPLTFGVATIYTGDKK